MKQTTAASPMAVTHYITGDQLTYMHYKLSLVLWYVLVLWLNGWRPESNLHMHTFTFFADIEWGQGLYDGQMGSPPSPLLPSLPSIPPSLPQHQSVCLYMYLSPSLNRWTPENTGTLLICCTHTHKNTHIYPHSLKPNLF